MVKLVGPTQFTEDVNEVYGLEFASEKVESRKELVTKCGLRLKIYVKIGKNIPEISIIILLSVFSGGMAESSQPMERNRSDKGKGSFQQPMDKELLEHRWCCFVIPRFFMFEELSMLIFTKVKDACGWFHDNKVEKGVDGYVGGLPTFLISEGVSTLATSYNLG